MNSSLESNSIFFRITNKVDSIIKKEKLNKQVGEVTIKIHDLYNCVLGKNIKIKFADITLCNSVNSQVFLVSSPEAEAISGAGAFIPSKKRLKFCIPRYHLGIPAQLDKEVAMFQLASTPSMKNIINKSSHKNSGVIYFAREGHLAQWQKAVYLLTGKNLPTTIVSISHKPANNVFTRESHFGSNPNLEGFNLRNLEYLYICDPVASGMQHIAMIEKLQEFNSLPKTVVVIAPMATKYGLLAIAVACKELGVNFIGGTCATLLDSNAPLRYYSPYPQSVDQVVDKDLHRFVRKHFKDVLHKPCIRCNWSATFFGGPKMPLEASEEELRSVGLSNKLLLDLCNNVSVDSAKSFGVYNDLIPYSTKLINQGI